MIRKNSPSKQHKLSSAARGERKISDGLSPAAAAILRERLAELPPLEKPSICLSPLLWSESFGLLPDG